MVKIPTLYKKNPDNLALVINEVNPLCSWVISGMGIATRKFDGSAAAIINGELYKRYDVKKGRNVPVNAIPCQEPDEATGHWPHWVKVSTSNSEDKYFVEAYFNQAPLIDGTYELCGPKLQGNPEKYAKHYLIKHADEVLSIKDYSFEYLRHFLSTRDIEGIVFHHKTDGRMCKIRKSDFGIKR